MLYVPEPTLSDQKLRVTPLMSIDSPDAAASVAVSAAASALVSASVAAAVVSVVAAEPQAESIIDAASTAAVALANVFLIAFPSIINVNKRLGYFTNP